MAVASGTRLGRYEIIAPLGAGGMGEVYRARDTRLGRDVAVKVLRASFSDNKERFHRFEQEACTAGTLNHPNILSVHDVGTHEGAPYIVSELLEGETLRKRLSRSRLNLKESLDVAIQVASALTAAHKAGVVHRDIKPENIVIRNDDSIVKVLDFGLAKATEKWLAQASADPEAATKPLVNTRPGVVMGTATYMSPEQARGLPVDERTDIWSLGVVLYEMVAGRPPFQGQTDSDVMATILHKEPLTLMHSSDEATERLDEVVAKALAKDREERYQVAKDLLIDLKRLKQHLDLESEIERTFTPEMGSSETRASDGAGRLSAQTAAISDAISTRASSAEYLVNEIRTHKRVAAVVALAIVAIAATAAYFAFFRKSAALTDKDTILLADFVNTTGDAVFDGALKQALAVQLGQSPFFNIFSDDRVRDALRFMGRSPDERVTRDIAREICERQGLKALLAGSISSLGNVYVITLEAVNAQTGDAIAREQAETERKEEVLNKLGEAATRLREKLGESLVLIQKFDAPASQATTSSLPALKAFSLALDQQLKGKYAEAIPFYKRAIELDPNFALAYVQLSSMYSNTRQVGASEEAVRKAFDLRGRVSEREKFYIESEYYSVVTKEVDKEIEILQLWITTYPREGLPHNGLAVRYLATGAFERTLEEARKAISLYPNVTPARSNLASAFLRLNRYEEAKQVINEALALKLESSFMHSNLHAIAFIKGDSAAMKQQIDWAKDKPEEYAGIVWDAEAAEFLGQLRKARELTDRAVDLAQARELKENAAEVIALGAVREAVFDNCAQVKPLIERALRISRNPRAVVGAAWANSICGDAGAAQVLADEISKRYPKDTLANAVYLPVIRARLQLQRGNAAEAVQLLESAHRFEAVGFFWPQYVRGQAYLKLNKGAEAAVEFQQILDHRGWYPRSFLYPLAELGIAHATVLMGDAAKARKAYQDFFALWKDADSDIPILAEAKKEYERLK